MTTRGWERIAIAAVACGVTLPFLDKPFHIDDTFFLRITENVLADVLDPFAGTIDWWDRPLPVWELASNPPLLSYYLAPFAAVSGTSEVVLHASLIPFVVLLGLATESLGRRFTSAPLASALFVVTSAAVVASLNVMRDVPAAALAASAMACVVSGTDRGRGGRVWLGFGLAGTAMLTRFTAVSVLPLLVLYPLLRGRRGYALGLVLPVGLFALWCAHNIAVYGETQLAVQLHRGHNAPGHAWRDNLAGLPVAVGSLCLLWPVLIARVGLCRDWGAAVVTSAAMIAVAAATWAYLGGTVDAQQLVWSVAGAALLALVALGGARDAAPERAGGTRSDALFLLAWLGAQIVVAVILAPFQAARHVTPMLVPLVLLGVRAAGLGQGSPRAMKLAAAGALAAQLALAIAAARADQEYAEAHRDFASRAVTAYSTQGEEVWFLGHWGWLYYAERAGLRKLHSTGPYPAVGDRLVVPVHVDKGRVLSRLPQLERRLRKLDEVVYPGSTPLRTVHRGGAGFYALRTRRPRGQTPDVPIRYLPGSPVEVYEVYEIAGPGSP